jgi:hypothetical protein
MQVSKILEVTLRETLHHYNEAPMHPLFYLKRRPSTLKARPCLRVYYNAKILARRSSLLERWLAEELTFSARAQKTCQLNQTEVDSVALPLGLHVFL